MCSKCGRDAPRGRGVKRTLRTSQEKYNPSGWDAKGLTQTLTEIHIVFSGQSERVPHPQPFGLKRRNRQGLNLSFAPTTAPAPPVLALVRGASRPLAEVVLFPELGGDSVFTGKDTLASGCTARRSAELVDFSLACASV